MTKNSKYGLGRSKDVGSKYRNGRRYENGRSTEKVELMRTQNFAQLYPKPIIISTVVAIAAICALVIFLILSPTLARSRIHVGGWRAPGNGRARITGIDN